MHYEWLEPPNWNKRWRGVEPTLADDAKATEECQRMSDLANSDDDYNQFCIAGEKVFYVDYAYGLMPGHIYSDLGMEEFKITRTCEYHFDEWTSEPEE